MPDLAERTFIPSFAIRGGDRHSAVASLIVEDRGLVRLKSFPWRWWQSRGVTVFQHSHPDGQTVCGSLDRI